MEFTLDSLIGILGLLFGGGALGGIATWRWQRKKAKAEAQTAEVNMAKEVQDIYQQALKDKEDEVIDKNRIIGELREDRDHYRKENNELRQRQDQTDAKVRELAEQVYRNGRMVKAMRPFLCFDTKCKKRQRVPASECEVAESVVKDIEPIDQKDM
jgi:cell division protein FtsB